MSAATATSRSDSPSTPWWLILIDGIALIVLGLLLLANPGMTTLILVQFIGIYWLLVGIFKIVSIFLDHTMWGWRLFAGILGIIAGIIVFRHPLWSSAVLGATLVAFVGISGIIIGAIRIYQAFKGAGWASGVLGVVGVLLGILLLANLWLFTFSLPWTIGILSIVGGIVALIGAFRQKQDEDAAAAAVPASMATRTATVDVDEAAEETPEVVAVVDEATEVVEQVDIPEPTSPEEMAKFSYDLEYIEGIGQVYGQKLKAIGIGTPLDLLRQGATRKGRQEIAQQTEISPKLILSWVNFVDLFRIKGVGSEYADLLERAGVDTVPELAQRNAQNLLRKIAEVNEEKQLVRRVPDISQIEDWIAQAKQLPRVVTY
jgi:uncharacterized membrane protein HdeD (DUF308 family)/predicted flap endonuclease-1-like 5' DNA nuclease